MTRPSLARDCRTLTVRVQLTLRKRSGRKLVLAPEGGAWVPTRLRVDNSMVKAIARAFRWRKLLETGVHSSLEEIASIERINSSYVSRVLRLTLLSPNIVEAILDGRQPVEMTLAALKQPFPVEWERQRVPFGFQI